MTLEPWRAQPLPDDEQADLRIEEWRPVVGFEGHYSVSNFGRVLSFKRPEQHILRGSVDRKGYRKVFLALNGVKHERKVHVLVAAAFIGPRPEGLVIRHLDGTKLNNWPENLAYGTASENQLDSVRHGTNSNANRTHCPQGHAYDSTNTKIMPNGARNCRACRRDEDRARYAYGTAVRRWARATLGYTFVRRETVPPEVRRLYEAELEGAR